VGALRRRRLLQAAALAGLGSGAAAADAAKVLRIAFAGSEAGFDPVQLSDAVSTAIVGSLFDAPLAYAHLARPAALVPNTAVALPEVSENHQRFVFRLRPGTLFADHPAFGGRARELVAADYVYSLKRYWDPAHPSPVLFHYRNAGLLGLAELRRQARETGRFDYDREVPGLRVLDRYRFELRTDRPVPRLPWVFASPALAGALAREVIEAEPGRSMMVPVGTGPYRLGAWTRSARIVLERNPAYRRRVFDETPAPGDAEGEVIAARLHGLALPLVDRVEITIIQEAQPRWLAFLNGDLDQVTVPPEFSALAAPHGRPAPHLARRGVKLHPLALPQTWFVYFAMNHPEVGGNAPERVALRRAVALAYDAQREIDLVAQGAGVRAQSVMPPGVSGWDPALKTEAGDHDPARAKALLDLYGWVDRDGDGWREQPDGRPFELIFSTEPSQKARAQQALWKSAMDAVGLRIGFRVAQWQENIKAARAGRLMMWNTGWVAALPDGQYFLDLLYGPNAGQSNTPRFSLPAFDRLYEDQQALPDGRERDALIAQAMRLSVAYMPYVPTYHPLALYLTQPWVHGYRPHPFARDFWRWMDVD
jgi:ABC-type transport system substrate-binding protein